MPRIYIFLLLVIMPIIAKSQDSMSFVDVEQKTMDFYYASQWDSLIQVGNVGLENGHDYYYLRLRLGVACFYKEKYTKAIVHLEKAIAFGSRDEFIDRFLYLSYLYSGRPADAEIVGKRLSDSTRAQDEFRKKPFFSGLYLESGISPASSYTPTPIEKGPNSNFYENSTKNGGMQYVFVGLTNRVAPWLSLFYGYTYLNASVTDYSYEKQPLVMPNPPTIKTTTTDNWVHQNQYYINARLRIAKGLILSPYYHKINITSSLLENMQDSVSVHANNPNRPNNKSASIKDGILGIGIEKYYRNFVFMAEVSNNKLNAINHLQTQIGATWFPYYNQNLYLNATFVSNQTSQDSMPSYYVKNKTFFSVKVGGKLTKKLWGETTLYSGNIQDSHIGNGFLAFNTPNNYSMMANATLTLVLKKVKLSLKYQFASLTGAKEIIVSPINLNTTYSNYSFQQQTITGGLLWNF